jgi:hypothetical protein
MKICDNIINCECGHTFEAHTISGICCRCNPEGDNMSAQLDLDDVVVGSKSELAINELAQLRNEKENVENLLIKSHNQYADLYADNAQLRNRIKELEQLVKEAAPIMYVHGFWEGKSTPLPEPPK